jgi:hypothetical protein
MQLLRRVVSIEGSVLEDLAVRQVEDRAEGERIILEYQKNFDLSGYNDENDHWWARNENDGTRTMWWLK